MLKHHPSLAEPGPDGEDLWAELTLGLFRLSLFTGAFAENDLPTIARVHRLIGAHVRLQAGPALSESGKEVIDCVSRSLFKVDETGHFFDLNAFLESRGVYEEVLNSWIGVLPCKALLVLLARILDVLTNVKGHSELAFDVSRHARLQLEAELPDVVDEESGHAFAAISQAFLRIRGRFFGFGQLLDDALISSMNALRIFNRALPADHPQLIPANNDVGFILRYLDRPQEAIPYLDKALRLCQEYAQSNGEPFIDEEVIKDNLRKAKVAIGANENDIKS